MARLAPGLTRLPIKGVIQFPGQIAWSSSRPSIDQNSRTDVNPQEKDEKTTKVSEEESWKTLAFPSISTLDFRFDHAKAAEIVVETVSEFLNSEESSGLRLAMVDIRPDMLNRVRTLADTAGVDSRRFLTVKADITRLRSMDGPDCFAIANAANMWMKSSGTGGVNLAIIRAAGPGFEEASRRGGRTLDVGQALAVPLPGASPLRNQGVTHVIHVLGPNMSNPRRPNCLGNNYAEGCRLLRVAYTNLFSTFASLANGAAGKS